MSTARCVSICHHIWCGIQHISNNNLSNKNVIFVGSHLMGSGCPIWYRNLASNTRAHDITFSPQESWRGRVTRR